MTAAAASPYPESPVPALPPEVTPAAIRDALIDEERDEFEQAYRKAITEAEAPCLEDLLRADVAAIADDDLDDTTLDEDDHRDSGSGNRTTR